MNNSIFYSIILHIFFALFIFCKLPISHENFKQENTVVIDIVDLAEVTNLPNKPMPIKNIETKDETVHTTKEEKKEDIAPPPPPPQKVEEVKEVTEPTNEPQKPEPVIEEKPKAEVNEQIQPKKENIEKIEKKTKDKKVKDPPKKPAIPTEKDKKKKSDDWSENVLKSIKTSSKEKQAKNIYEEVDEVDKAIKSYSDAKYDKRSPKAIRLNAAVNKHVQNFWKVGPFRGSSMKAEVMISLDENGKVLKIDVLGGASTGDSRYQAFIASIKRAIYDAFPFSSLQKKDYEAWKEMKLVFDPKDTW